MSKIKKFFKSKALHYGGFSVLTTVIFIALAVLLNVVAGLITDRFNVKLDLTKSKLFSVEDSTREFLQNLDSDVYISFASDRTGYESYGLEFQQTSEIAQQFAKAGSHVKVEYVDYLKDPNFSNKYSTDQTPLSQASIVIRGEKTGRFKALAVTDYLNVKYFANGQEISSEEAQYYQMIGYAVEQDVSAAAEQQFMSAIMSVTDESPVKIALSSGFGEGVYDSLNGLASDDFTKLLATNAYIIEPLDLNVTETIPNEYDYMMIFDPSIDYDFATLNKIDSWLDNGGLNGKTLIYISGVGTDTPNLDGFLEDWGLAVEKGVAYQTDANYAYQSGYQQLLQVAPDSPYITSGTLISLGYVAPVTRLFTEQGGFITTPILETFDGAVLQPFDADETWTPDGKEKAARVVAVQSERSVYIGSERGSSRVIVFGGPYLFLGSVLTEKRFSNAELYLGMFAELSGRDAQAAITPKSFAISTFQITAAQSNGIALVFVVIIPLIFIVWGIVTYVRRRYR